MDGIHVVKGEASDGEEGPRHGRKLGDLLVERGLLSRVELSEALLQQSASGKRIGSLLVEQGAIDETDLVVVLSEQLGVPVADLHRREPEPEALERIPESVARSVMAVPLSITAGDTIEVALADPSDEAALKPLRETSGLHVRALIAAPSDIRRVLDAAYRALAGIESHVEAFEEAERRRRLDRPPMEVVAEDAPVVTIVNLIVTQAMRDRASDIHLEPTQDRIRLRFRIDGALHDVLSFPSELGPALVSRIKILGGMNIVERRRPQDGQFTHDVDGAVLDVRVSTTATIWGEKAVLRLLDKGGTPLRLKDLGLPGLGSDGGGLGSSLGEIIHSPFGMVVVAGPTGSGKTTTLYATIAEIDRRERNLMTIEDPVEYVLPSINQMQINEAAGVTFASGLKSILRQDPDVILVGEIRDAETARLAVQSALTGHFVLSSIHATDAAAALHRFLDMQIEAFLIASSMLAMVSQRLVRRVCTHCRTTYVPSPEELAFYERSGGPEKDRSTFVRGEGCNFCSQSGFRERIGVFEMLRVTGEIKELIIRKASHEELRSAGVAQGMVPMRTAAMHLVADGVTTIDEVLRAIYLL